MPIAFISSAIGMQASCICRANSTSALRLWKPASTSASRFEQAARTTAGRSGHSAFAASVLLRQGQADEIITATGSKRLAILKKLIGVERYEGLSDRVHATTRLCKDRLEGLCTRRDAMTRVTEEEVEAARDELARAEEDRSKAHDAVAKAVERVPLARQWVNLEAEAQTLTQEIREADTRAADACRIERPKIELGIVIAGLRRLLVARGHCPVGCGIGQSRAEIDRRDEAASSYYHCPGHG